MCCSLLWRGALYGSIVFFASALLLGAIEEATDGGFAVDPNLGFFACAILSLSGWAYAIKVVLGERG